MHPLAVVPVVVNAGAAILPAIIAGAGATLGLLFRPRALLNACRSHPIKALATFTALIAATIAIYFLTTLRTAAAAPPTGQIDWAAIARDLQRDQQSPHKLFVPLWENRLDNELALATPALFTPLSPTGSKQNPIIYQPAMILTAERQAGTFWALDARTGKQLWKADNYSLPNNNTKQPLRAIFSWPVISADGSRVITGQGLHDDANCSLVCFDTAASAAAQAGRAAWAVPTPLHLESSPSIFTVNGDQRVVIGAGAIEGPDKKAIGNPGYIFCVSVSTGKELWQYQINDPEAQPVVDSNNIIYAGSAFNGNAVVALRSGTPEELNGQNRLIWRQPTRFPASGDPLLAHDNKLGDLLLLGGGNGDFITSDPKPIGLVMVFNRADGKPLWQTELPDSVLGRLCVRDQTVLAPCRDGNVYALNLATGKQIWHSQVSAPSTQPATPTTRPVSPIPHPAAPDHATPILAGIVSDGPYAFAIAADGTLAALNLADGQVVDRIKLADPNKPIQNYTLATPLLANHVLYVPTETSGLQVFTIAW